LIFVEVFCFREYPIRILGINTDEDIVSLSLGWGVKAGIAPSICGCTCRPMGGTGETV